jgi:hypothetical protein
MINSARKQSKSIDVNNFEKHKEHEYYYGRPPTPEDWPDPMQAIKSQKDINLEVIEPLVDRKNLPQSKSQVKLLRKFSEDI